MTGSIERTVALLSSGTIDIDQRDDQKGFTPLTMASVRGHSAVVRILLNNGANASMVADEGCTALRDGGWNRTPRHIQDADRRRRRPGSSY